MNLSSIFVAILLIIGVLVYAFQTKPDSDGQASKLKEVLMEKEAVHEEAPPAPVRRRSTLPEPAAAPMPAAVEPAAPISWYTARRVSAMTDTGVSSVPAGMEVSKVGDTEILYNGKRFTVKPGDLTTDVLVVADILAKQDAAELLAQRERQMVEATEQANVASLQAHAEDKKAERRAQVAATIASIDRQISALQEKIRQEQNKQVSAAVYNRISGHGAVISKCQMAIAKLEAERQRLSQME